MEPNYFREVGAERLLSLADFLDICKPDLAPVIDGVSGYNQSKWFHDCGTPACAMGHYVTQHPDRWRNLHGTPRLINSVNALLALDIKQEFGITITEVNELFGAGGCGEARRDPQRAAAYIRDFVERKLMCPVGQEGT